MTGSVRVGDQIVATEYGPLTIVDTVRWAGIWTMPSAFTSTATMRASTAGCGR